MQRASANCRSSLEWHFLYTSTCKCGRSSRRPSTVGEQFETINGNENKNKNDVPSLFTAIYGQQLCSFAIHTKQTKSWPLFGASSAAIRWWEDCEIIKILQLRTPTFGFVHTVSLSLGHKATLGSPKLLLSRIVKRLDPFDLPAEYDIPCSMQPFR